MLQKHNYFFGGGIRMKPLSIRQWYRFYIDPDELWYLDPISVISY